MVCRVFVRSRAASLERSDRHSGGHLRRRRGPSRRGLERGECFCVDSKDLCKTYAFISHQTIYRPKEQLILNACMNSVSTETVVSLNAGVFRTSTCLGRRSCRVGWITL